MNGVVEMLGLDDVERQRQAVLRAIDVKRGKELANAAIEVASKIDARLDDVAGLLLEREDLIARIRVMSVAAAARSALDQVNFAPVVAVAIISRLEPFVKPLLNNSLGSHQKVLRLKGVTADRLNKVMMLSDE